MKLFVGEELIIDLRLDGVNNTEIVYTRQIEVPARSEVAFTLLGLGQKQISFAVFQVHVYYFNVTLQEEGSASQKGGNIGFVLKPDANKKIQLANHNFDNVQCLVGVIAYNRSAPLINSCGSDTPCDSRIKLEENENFVIAKVQHDNASIAISNEFFTYYAYLERMSAEAYFEGIKSLMYDSMFHTAYKAKQVHSPFMRYFEKRPGTGIVINTVIVSPEGRSTFFIPAVTYSCPHNTWNAHCTDIDMLKRALSVLLVLYAIVLMLNLVMPELLEAAMNGMLAGSFTILMTTKSHQAEMSNFAIFMSTVIGGVFFAAVFAVIAFRFRIGRFLTKLTFSNLLMVVIFEVIFDSYTSIYLQFGGAFALAVVLHFVQVSFSVFLGGLLLINGLSLLLRVGNIHRMFINNFLSLSLEYPSDDDSIWNFNRSNFINYKLELNLVDASLLIFYVIISILLTARREIFFRNNPNLFDGHMLLSETDEAFNRRVGKSRRDRKIVGIRNSKGKLRLVSRYRRHHYRSNVINERSPLISHWLTSEDSDDEVFVSPNSNSRFMRTLSSSSLERIDAIQNFSE